MFILHASKFFTSGILVGLTYPFQMTFATEAAAIEWATFAEKGIDKPIGGSPYRVLPDWIVCPAVQ